MHKMIHTKFRIVWFPWTDPLSRAVIVGGIQQTLEDYEDLQYRSPKITNYTDLDTNQQRTDIVIGWKDETTAGRQDLLVQKINRELDKHNAVIKSAPQPVGYPAEPDYSVD